MVADCLYIGSALGPPWPPGASDTTVRVSNGQLSHQMYPVRCPELRYAYVEDIHAGKALLKPRCGEAWVGHEYRHAQA